MKMKEFIEKGYRVVENIEVIQCHELNLEKYDEEDEDCEVKDLTGEIIEAFVLDTDSTYSILTVDGEVGFEEGTLIEDASWEEIEEFIEQM